MLRHRKSFGLTVNYADYFTEGGAGARKKWLDAGVDGLGQEWQIRIFTDLRSAFGTSSLKLTVHRTQRGLRLYVSA